MKSMEIVPSSYEIIVNDICSDSDRVSDIRCAEKVTLLSGDPDKPQIFVDCLNENAVVFRMLFISSLCKILLSVWFDLISLSEVDYFS